MPPVPTSTCRGGVVLAVLVALSGASLGVGLSPAAADVTAVTGGAFTYYTEVGLFEGPAMRRGHGQPEDAPEDAMSPSVECPEDGGRDSATAPDGARGVYGPAAIFGGIWPYPESPTAPPSGPLTAEVDCQLGADGYVTASASVTLMPPGSTWSPPENYPHPGGIGPGPLIAEEVTSTCTMTDDEVTTEVTFESGVVETSYNPETQEPATTEPIPERPEPGYTVEGTIDHVGDSYRITFNEQIEGDDGSITVNAARMELLGPIAVGEMVVGQARCGVTATPTDTTETTTEDEAQDTATPTPDPSPEDVAAAPTGGEENGGVPLAAIAIGALVLVAIAVGVLLTRRARSPGDA